jgi:predicted RNA methylase
MFLDEFQYKVQGLVDRKKTSSYYTSPDGVTVIRYFLKEVGVREGIVLMDPFMGSGVTLSSVNDLVKPSKVIGIEISKIPCELGRKILSSIYDDVEVVCDDAFNVGWKYKADLVISNPPFVRWHLISNRDEVLNAVISHGYKNYVTRKDPGVHILSFFLIDSILKDGGCAILVLPASTFYTSQGGGLKKLLKYGYDVLAIVENLKEASFSSGSGYKELIIFLKKKSFSFTVIPTPIYQYDGSLKELYSVNVQGIPKFMDRNWLSLFNYERAKRVVELIQRGLESGLLRYLKKDEILRGVEMYGSEFFFLPNTYWNIEAEEGDYVVTRNGWVGLRIHKKYLIKCLRKPEYYNDEIVIRDPKFYVLVIDDEPQGDLRKYVEWGEKEKIPALKFGKEWYQHIWKQLQTKKPYGHIFIHDKLDLERNRILANYSETPICASKNFYIIRTKNPLIAAWFNSSIMRDILHIFGKRISSKWTRLLENDYLAIPIPSKYVNVDLNNLQNMEKVIKEYLGIKGTGVSVT